MARSAISSTEVVELQQALALEPVSKTVTPRVSHEGQALVTTSQDAVQYPALSPLRAAVVCITVSGITFVTSMTTGCLTTAIPSMAEELNMAEGLILWPAAIYALTSGCTFILVGSIADVIGSRLVYLTGCVFLIGCILACGLARTGLELIVFRGVMGVASSLCLPTAISILTQTFAPGRARTRGLAIQGASMPIGYSAGHFIGGAFVGSIGWRWGWYITVIVGCMVFAMGLWAIPHDKQAEQRQWSQMITGVDWIGALTLSSCLGLISYVLAITSSSIENIKQPTNIALLALGGVLAPVSFSWMRYREKHGKIALIPSSVWSNRYFSTVSAMLFLVSVDLNSSEYFFSLFFQKVQMLSALQASLRFLPEIIVGAFFSFATDAVLHKWSTYYLVLSVSLASAVAPLLMVFMMPQWSYWFMEFWAMVLLPVANDVLFIVAAVVVADAFPASRQALAGSILNTVYQLGTAVGLGLMAVAATTVTSDSSYEDKGSPSALLEGYRATFWACFAATVTLCVVGAMGLRGVGKVGLKTD